MNVKKTVVSALVVLGFVVYALHKQIENSQTPIVGTQNFPATSGSDQTQNVTPASEATPAITPSTIPASGGVATYKDGTYVGPVTDALYGNIQVKAIISGGKIADVQFLQYPNDRGTSIEINQQAMPMLRDEAIAAQSSNVDTISGATQTSRAFRESLDAILSKAKS